MFAVFRQKTFSIRKILRKYHCEICKKRFTLRISLANHQESHNSLKKLPSTSLRSLNKNSKNISKNKIFRCNFENCDRKFTREFRLKVHLRNHSSYNPFKCPECGKRFNEKSNLKIHFRIHTGEKPYVCDFQECGKSFRTQGHLKEHLRGHNFEKEYECQTCLLKFARKSTLIVHFNTHIKNKPFECDYKGCGKSFALKGNLKVHYKTHLKEKNFILKKAPSKSQTFNKEINKNINLNSIRKNSCTSLFKPQNQIEKKNIIENPIQDNIINNSNYLTIFNEKKVDSTSNSLKELFPQMDYKLADFSPTIFANNSNFNRKVLQNDENINNSDENFKKRVFYDITPLPLFLSRMNSPCFNSNLMNGFINHSNNDLSVNSKTSNLFRINNDFTPIERKPYYNPTFSEMIFFSRKNNL